MNIERTVPAARATMADVAREAKVSLKSVSRVINDEPHVSPKLREKVEAAIASLDYVPDTAARSLAGAKSFTIGVMFDNPSPHYTMQVQAGVYRACFEQKHHLRIDNIDSAAAPEQLLEQLRSLQRHGRVDGFVLTPPLTDNSVTLEFLASNQIRYSRIAPVTEDPQAADVTLDDESAGARVAELFWSKGHRRFGIVAGPEAHGAAIARRRGFIEQLKSFDPAVHVEEAYGGFQFESGMAATDELLQAEHRPTAIFALNDDSAAGAIVACQRAGLRVPQDISICGFDDSWVAKSVWPYLTTVKQPVEEMAHAAAMQLLERNNQDREPEKIAMPFELIVRDSVGEAPQTD